MACFLIPVSVLAATSEGVTITATGYICEAPGAFTLTYISDYEIGISWVKGADAVNTMVRKVVGRVPASLTDGIELYNGPGTSTADYTVNLDTIDSSIYYRAWSQNAAGVWEELGTSNAIGGFGMSTVAIAVIVLGLTALAFVLKNALLHMVCVIGWLFLGFYMWNREWPVGNEYLGTAFMLLALAMVIVNLIVTVNHYLGQRTTPPTHDEVQNEYRRKVLNVTGRREPRDPWL